MEMEDGETEREIQRERWVAGEEIHPLCQHTVSTQHLTLTYGKEGQRTLLLHWRPLVVGMVFVCFSCCLLPHLMWKELAHLSQQGTLH